MLCARVPEATAAAVIPWSAVGASTTSALGIALDRTLWSWLILAVALVVLVFAPRIWRSRLGRSRARIVASFVLLGWVVFVFGAHSHIGPQPQVATGGNPVPASAEAIEAGRQLYQQQCAGCHGASGLGDGPQAANLKPPPADLRLHVPLHPDSQIYGFISGGFPGSAMPAFAGRLTDTEMWNLVHYLRSLTQTTTQ